MPPRFDRPKQPQRQPRQEQEPQSRKISDLLFNYKRLADAAKKREQVPNVEKITAEELQLEMIDWVVDHLVIPPTTEDGKERRVDVEFVDQKQDAAYYPPKQLNSGVWQDARIVVSRANPHYAAIELLHEIGHILYTPPEHLEEEDYGLTDIAADINEERRVWTFQLHILAEAGWEAAVSSRLQQSDRFRVNAYVDETDIDDLPRIDFPGKEELVELFRRCDVAKFS